MFSFLKRVGGFTINLVSSEVVRILVICQVYILCIFSPIVYWLFHFLNFFQRADAFNLALLFSFAVCK